MDERRITIDEARNLVADDALWPRVRDFLWDFAPQVHPSWTEGMGGPGCGNAVRGLAASRRVKSWLLGELGVAPCFHAFPQDDCSRVLLLDGATLESVARWLGALACEESLRRITDGATVRELRSSLPGVYPDVFGYTMYFRGLAGCDEGGAAPRTGADVEAAGVAMLASALRGGAAKSVVKRLRFKFPKQVFESSSGFSPKASQETLRTSLYRLLKLKFPEAHSLCCS